MLISRRRASRAVLPAAVMSLGLLVAACGATDASRADYKEQLTEGANGLSDEEADCVIDSIFEDLDQEQINKLYESDTPEEAGEEASAALGAATTECLGVDVTATPEAGG